MSKRFTFKSVLTLVVILFSALVLVACGDDENNDKALIETAVASLELPFATGDSATNVTADLELPTTAAGDIQISWSSSNAAVISTAGVVTRPAYGQNDVTVTLTATLTLGSETGEKQFTVVVKAMAQTDAEAVAAAKAALAIGFATSDSANSVTANLTLPATQGTTAVTWSSNNTAVISNSGVVTRPVAGSEDAVVILTATITKGSASDTKEFTVTVKAHPVVLTDQDEVDEALAVLSITLHAGDTMSAITGNITLPATSNGLDIVWTSTNTTFITNEGVVTRPAKGEEPRLVRLQAEITKGNGYGFKDFVVTVLPIPYTLEDALAELTITGTALTYNEETEQFTTTADIVLPATFFGFDVTWSSANPAVISNTGVVTRPAYGQTDSTVVLTATILEEDVYIVVVVPAITVKPDSLIIQEAYDSLLLAGIGNGVASDLVLPTTVGTEGVTVTWSSDTPDVLSNLGVVNRQPEHTNVILTATLHYNDLTREKVFEIVVLRFADFHEVENLQEAIEWFQGDTDPEDPRIIYVKVPGVTVLGRTADGFMFGDSTAVSFAYTGGQPNANWQVGQVYDIYGLVDFYNGNIQFNGVKSVSQPIQMIPSDAEVTVLTPTPVTDIVAYIASLPQSHPDKSNVLTHQYIQLTAKVRYQSSDNYHTIFVNPDYDGPDILTAAQTPFTDNALIVYYSSNKAAIAAFDGLTITVNVFLYSLRNDRNLFTVIFTGTADDIEFTLTDTEVVDLAGDLATKDIPTEIIENQTLTLPSALVGTEISWTSSNEAVINPATGEVTIPETGQVVVTLTAEVTKNDVTKTFPVTIAVGELEVLTVAAAKDITTGTVRVQGVVTGIITNRTFAIQDETGAIAVYVLSADVATWLGYVGKEIDLIGTRGAFNGLLQINPVEITVLGDGTLPVAVNIDDVALDATGLLPYMVTFVTRTGLEVIGKPSQSFGNVLLNLKDPVTEELINIFWDSRVVVADGNIADIEVGDFINLIGVPVGWSNGPRFEYTKATQIVKVEFIPETDQEKVDAAALALADQPATVMSNITLSLEANGLYGTTVAWSSNDTDVITNDGVVTVPFDAVTVTMTATVTLNDATATRNFVIEVKENVQTVAAVRALPVNELVIIEGLVTSIAVATDGRVVAFIEDDTAGIYLYKVAAADADKVVPGNIIRVYGKTAVFNNLIQITTFTNIVVISEDNDVVPTVVTDPALIAGLQGSLVQVSGYLRQAYASGSDYFLITDQGQFQLRLVSGSDIASNSAISAKIYAAPAGSYITIVAGVGQFASTMQIMLFDADAITVGSIGSDEELLAAAAANLALPAESDELVANLTLPLTGYLGTTVVWASSNEDVIATNGAVTRPAAGTSDVEVTLTYTVTLNEEVFEGTLVFTVLALTEEGGEEPGEEVLLTTYNFSAVTGSGTTLTDTTLQAAFDAGFTGTNTLTSITNTERIYAGNGTGGAYPNTGGLLKTGTSSINGSFTMNLTDANVTKVVIYLQSWLETSNDTMSINGSDSQIIPGTAGQSLTFEFDTPTNVLTFLFVRRAFIFSIELYTTGE